VSTQLQLNNNNNNNNNNNKYKLDLAGVQEVRWDEVGTVKAGDYG
jgi:hypothetical protein